MGIAPFFRSHVFTPGRFSIAAAATIDTEDTPLTGIPCTVCARLPAIRPMIWLQDEIPADVPLPRCCDLCWLRAERSAEARAWKSRRRNRSTAAVCFSCSAAARAHARTLRSHSVRRSVRLCAIQFSISLRIRGGSAALVSDSRYAPSSSR